MNTLHSLHEKVSMSMGVKLAGRIVEALGGCQLHKFHYFVMDNSEVSNYVKANYVIIWKTL